MTRRRSPIEPPPSLEDILTAGAAGRVGSVDFGRLTEPPVPVAAPVETVRTEVPAAAAEEPAPAPAAPEAEVEAEPEVEPEPAPQPAPVTEIQAVTEPSRAPVFDSDLLEHGSAPSVEELAATVVAHMRAAEVATLRHLEAVEAEAARRCELLTAQAELDAELIRLHARREAHAIVAAARMRTGEVDRPVQHDRRLDEIGETFTRFAEAFESTVASATWTPDTTSDR